MNFVVASTSVLYASILDRVVKEPDRQFTWISDKNELTSANLQTIRPRFVFFPHWSFIVPPEVYENFECIIFHMTDVPYGRGGTPLQNLVIRGVRETRMTALRCTGEIDGGPVYMKKPLSLYGNAEEIYLRAARIIADMINEIVENEPTPVPQEGEVVSFQRRKPEESNISELESLEQVFDFIRMLDADGYPKAFLENARFRFEFSRASFKFDSILADVKITRKK